MNLRIKKGLLERVHSVFFSATRVLRVACGGSERGSALSVRTGVPAVGRLAVNLVPKGGGHAFPRAPAERVHNV